MRVLQAGSLAGIFSYSPHLSPTGRFFMVPLGRGGTQKRLSHGAWPRMLLASYLYPVAGPEQRKRIKSQRARIHAGRNKSAKQSRDLHHRYPGTFSSGPRVLVSIDLHQYQYRYQYQLSIPSFLLQQIHPPSSCLGAMSRESQYWLPGYGLSRHIVLGHIHYFLGPTASVRPFSYQVYRATKPAAHHG